MPGEQDQGFALAIVPAPVATDTVVESAGARVFLDPAVAKTLQDRTIDAEVGADGAVRFALRPRPDPAPFVRLPYMPAAARRLACI